MLSLMLMCELMKRAGNTDGMGHLLADVRMQVAMCLDATDHVDDGVEWFEDYDICGPVSRTIELREGGR